MTEWTVRPAEDAVLATLPGWLRDAIDPAQGFLGFRIYPWANDPALHAQAMRHIAAAGN